MIQESKSDSRYKWTLLGLLAFTYFLMHATRQIFNASLTDIKASLPGPTDAQWGSTRTAFLCAYGIVVPLAGIAADMLRRKWVVVVGAFLFSVSVLGTGFVDGFVGMLVMYGIMNGIGRSRRRRQAVLLQARQDIAPARAVPGAISPSRRSGLCRRISRRRTARRGTARCSATRTCCSRAPRTSAPS